MKQFLPPSVTPLVEEPIATDGRQDSIRSKLLEQNFTAARDAVGEEPIAMGGWYFDP